MRLGLGRVSACRGMKIRSAKCQSHQRFAVRHMMSKGFQNYISQLEKKTRCSSLVLFHTFCNLCKKFFFNVDEIKLAAYAEQLLPRSKAAMSCILPRGIAWMHLYTLFIELQLFEIKFYKNVTQLSIDVLISQFSKIFSLLFSNFQNFLSKILTLICKCTSVT